MVAATRASGASMLLAPARADATERGMRRGCGAVARGELGARWSRCIAEGGAAGERVVAREEGLARLEAEVGATEREVVELPEGARGRVHDGAWQLDVESAVLRGGDGLADDAFLVGARDGAKLRRRLGDDEVGEGGAVGLEGETDAPSATLGKARRLVGRGVEDDGVSCRRPGDIADGD